MLVVDVGFMFFAVIRCYGITCNGPAPISDNARSCCYWSRFSVCTRSLWTTARTQTPWSTGASGWTWCGIRGADYCPPIVRSAWAKNNGWYAFSLRKYSADTIAMRVRLPNWRHATTGDLDPLSSSHYRRMLSNSLTYPPDYRSYYSANLDWPQWSISCDAVPPSSWWRLYSVSNMTAQKLYQCLSQNDFVQ